MDGAAAVDKALYFVLRKCSFAEIDRQVDKARDEHDPAEAQRRYCESLEKRHLNVHLTHMTHDGLVPVSGMLDVTDAVAFVYLTENLVNDFLWRTEITRKCELTVLARDTEEIAQHRVRSLFSYNAIV